MFRIFHLLGNILFVIVVLYILHGILACLYEKPNTIGNLRMCMCSGTQLPLPLFSPQNDCVHTFCVADWTELVFKGSV